MKIKVDKKEDWVDILFFCVVLPLAIIVLLFIGYKFSKEEEKLNNKIEKITVIDCKNNTVLFEITGKLDVKVEGYFSWDELQIIQREDDGEKTYAICLNEYMTYIFEDITGIE